MMKKTQMIADKNQPYIKKYHPHRIKDIVGQDDAVAELKRYIQEKKHPKTALIYGPCGVGKTSSVYAIANDLDLEVIEVNASDFRNKQKIDETVGNALRQGSLFGKEKLILIDEVDGLSGTKDRGATQEIIKLFKLVLELLD
jgi:replication factor C large subunit